MRVDSGVYQGYRIPPYYDSLIGKLIVHGKNRNECLMRLRRCLSEFVIDGIETTIPLFADLVNEPDIANGLYDIHWLERFLQKPTQDHSSVQENAGLNSGPTRLAHGLARRHRHRDHPAGAAQGLCVRHLSYGGECRRPGSILDRTATARHPAAR